MLGCMIETPAHAEPEAPSYSPFRRCWRRVFRAFAIAAVALGIGASGAVAATDRAAVEKQFQAWLAAEMWPLAKAANVGRATFDRAFAGVTLDWTMPDLQPPGTPPAPPKIEWQAEFSAPGAYFDQRRLSALAAAGRDRLGQWSKTLAAVTRRTGVPAAIIVAIWAKESGFGAATMPKPAMSALATEAFMGRRAAFFRDELIAALVILQNGDIAADSMRSSVAGALGQPQFMPSQFLKYAEDFDGDGHRNIWTSASDSLASIGSYLKGEGWVAERGWGVEVKVRVSISCALDGPEQGKPAAEWAALGITRADGSRLPRDKGLSYLVMPAGRYGPAFLVTDNFYVLKRYNNSDLYALYVGHLADRFTSDRPFAGTWKPVGKFSRGEVKGMQDELVAEGYDVGNADGLVGFKTRIAIGLWQAKRGQAQTCFPDAKLIRGIH
jgi:lytic murein transglycosylase